MAITNKQNLWEEKYRPQTISDAILPQSITDQLSAYIKDKEFPSMILYSDSPGTGKTTTAFALCNDIGITDPLFINGSLNTGIDVLRNEVLQYATSVSMVDDAKHKAIIIDEGEKLSTAAQEALKGVMEEVSSVCRFIITTNNLDGIIAPLQSRCEGSILQYVTTDNAINTDLKKQMIMRCANICRQEGVELADKKAIVELVKDKFPDNRATIRVLQAYSKRNAGKIDMGILNMNVGSDIDGLVEIIAKKDFDGLGQWIKDNTSSLRSDYHEKLYHALLPRLGDKKEVGVLVMTLGTRQDTFAKAPSKSLHIRRTIVELFYELESVTK